MKRRCWNFCRSASGDSSISAAAADACSALVKAARPNAEAVAVDFSAAMLEVLRDAYRGDAKTSIVEHDLSSPLPELGKFDAVVSSFAIHHVRTSGSEPIRRNFRRDSIRAACS